MRMIPALFLALAVLSGVHPALASGKTLTFQDLMQFRKIFGTVISENGSRVACEARPDRGDGELLVLSPTGGPEYRIPRGTSPMVGADGRFVAAAVLPTLEEMEAAKKKGKKEEAGNGGGKSEHKDQEPRNGMAILDTSDGSLQTVEEVRSFALSRDGRFLAYRHYKPSNDTTSGSDETVETGERPTSAKLAASPETGKTNDAGNKDAPKPPEAGTRLVLRDLARGTERTFESVSSYALDETSRYLAFCTATETGEGNGAFLVDLSRLEADPIPLATLDLGTFGRLTWAKKKRLLAFLSAEPTEDGKGGDAVLWTWRAGKGGVQADRAARKVADSSDAPEGWRLPFPNQVEFSRDGKRLFFGFKPADPRHPKKKEDTPFDPYDLDGILENRQVDVWHWDDPRIIPNQKRRWEKTEKDRVYRAVIHLETGKVVPLADREVPEVIPSVSGRYALGVADTPYLKEITWVGEQFDLYRVDLKNGNRNKVAARLLERGSLSPDGRYVLYFQANHWRLYDGKTGKTRNLTAGMTVPFANEDHDYPSPRPSYGMAGWIGRDLAVLIYDKYDIWRFPLDGGAPVSITGGKGREASKVFRVQKLDTEQEFLAPDQPLLLSAYSDTEKTRGFYSGSTSGAFLRKIVEEPAWYSFRMKAKNADTILFTRETYREFPDLRSARLDLAAEGGAALADRKQLTRVNPQQSEFAWGRARLVNWSSADGVPLQGALILPADYQEGKRYPVLVYFYRFFSQRLYRFNDPVVNHRPSFPIYSGDGYAVFLPDIRFQVGTPGFSATKALVPGVQKLVELGVADPDRIGLHGHSWSGYQTAFVVTQTDIFKAAAAGAPVSNMTSAYSGIRLGSGLARQFQYEQSQSRIGGSLWEARDLYIENSPVFFADRIQTPLLIEAGDRDDAVPWQQSIEMYLAMRRLGKECWLLQYRDEPHHLKKYPNKLDYSIKMKQFFDHYLKGKPAPDWMVKGVPYRGK